MYILITFILYITMLLLESLLAMHFHLHATYVGIVILVLFRKNTNIQFLFTAARKILCFVK